MVPRVTALYTNLVLHCTTSSINHIKSSNYFNANMYSTPTKKLESNDDLHVFVHLRRAQGECVFSVGHFSWACIFSATEKSRYWATCSNYELLKTRWPFVGRKIVCALKRTSWNLIIIVTLRNFLISTSRLSVRSDRLHGVNFDVIYRMQFYACVIFYAINRNEKTTHWAWTYTKK